MIRVTIDEAKARLSRLIDEVRHGGDVVIIRDDKPIARLLPIEPVLAVAKPERKPGRMKGLIDIGP